MGEWLVISIVVVNGYTFGANCVERFVNYQSWPLIPGRSFARYHRAQQPLILGFVVAPQALAFLLQGWLFIEGLFRPVAWTLILASTAGALSTVLIQLPIHRRFNAEGYSPQEMRRLLRSDWIRKGADLIKLGATIVLLREVVRV